MGPCKAWAWRGRHGGVRCAHPTLAVMTRHPGTCTDLFQAAGGLVVAGTGAPARGRLALPLPAPRVTAAATQVRLGGVQLHPETTQAWQVDTAVHGALGKARESRAGHTANNASLQPHKVYWDGNKVNIDCS